LSQAAKWALEVPPGTMNNLSELFLKIDYQGDVARLYTNHRMLTDDFYDGKPWFIGLRRFLDPNAAGKFELSILPLRKDSPVNLELPQHLDFSGNGQVDKLDAIELLPEYELVIGAGSP
jgi:hypothetical protein